MDPSIRPVLFTLLHLTSSFVTVIIISATRGHHITVRVNMGGASGSTSGCSSDLDGLQTLSFFLLFVINKMTKNNREGVKVTSNPSFQLLSNRVKPFAQGRLKTTVSLSPSPSLWSKWRRNRDSNFIKSHCFVVHLLSCSVKCSVTLNASSYLNSTHNAA